MACVVMNELRHSVEHELKWLLYWAWYSKTLMWYEHVVPERTTVFSKDAV